MAQSMLRHASTQRSNVLLALILLMFAFVAGGRVSAAGGERQDLQLEVLINGQPTKLIASFTDVPGQGVFSPRSELAELFIRAPGEGPPAELVRLDRIPGLTFKLDKAAQTIAITLPDTQRLRRTYDAHVPMQIPEAGQANYSAVLNYSLYAAGTQNTDQFKKLTQSSYDGANAYLDGRVITPYGIVSQSAILGNNALGITNTLRLETSAVRVNPETLTTTRLGDTVSGGLPWTRPIRMAGAQWQQNYSARPDLVTGSLPSFSGSAAVPSTVDVYVNNVRAYSQQVGAGPFTLSNLPLMSGSGEARVVIRDATGKEQESAFAFYTAPRLLREGLFEASVEAGAPRLRYGVASDDYEAALVGSATMRRGVFDWLTLETHAEGGLGVVTGGIGGVARVGKLGVVSASISGSDSRSKTGTQGYASFDTKIGKVGLSASMQRAFGDYEDLAIVTSRLRPSVFSGSSLAGFYASRLSLATARAVDRVSLSVPVGFDTSINASLVHIESEDAIHSRLLIVSYSRPLIADASLFATVYKDFDDTKSAGVYVGVHVPLGKTRLGANSSASGGVSSTSRGTTYTADVTKSLGQDVGSWGWRVRDAEGDAPYREASVSHRAAIARVDAGVRQVGDAVSGRVNVDGAIVAAGGGTFLSNRVDDAFGVVSAGAPGVKVLHQNNLVGETNSDGKLLLPNLRSNLPNKVSIDPSNLPLDAEFDKTSTRVTPAFRSGVHIDFDVKTAVAAAIVILKNADGTFVPAGSELTLQGVSAPKTVGYDGQAYVNELKPQNSVSVKRPDGSSCQAQFSYKHAAGRQSVVGPIVCQ